jgi:glycosyltransferase involved in cell wall biosynthesis
VLEAMARGVPSVVGSTGALPELAEDAAVAVDAENVDAIAAGLERLLADEALRKKLGEEGRKRARNYTWKSAADGTVAALRRIARPRRIKVA